MALIWNPLYLSQNGLMAMKQESKHINWILDINCDYHFYNLGHDLDLEFSRNNMEFAISQLKMIQLPQKEKWT